MNSQPLKMALTTVHGGGGGGRILSTTPTRTVPTTTRRSTSFPIIHRHLLSPVSPSRPRTLHIALAKNKVSSRTGKFDSKNRRGAATTTTKDDQEDEADQLGDVIERVGPESSTMAGDSAGVVVDDDDEAFVMPELPGDKPGFWEGPQWDALGFFVQYMWAFGVVFALIACGIAVVTYNEGATDFKETPAYKESVQSRELLEEPDANSDVFESNPTEVAPSLE